MGEICPISLSKFINKLFFQTYLQYNFVTKTFRIGAQ